MRAIDKQEIKEVPTSHKAKGALGSKLRFSGLRRLEVKG
jgi:hypothetical protein